MGIFYIFCIFDPPCVEMTHAEPNVQRRELMAKRSETEKIMQKTNN